MRHARPDLSLLRPDSHGESFQALSRSGGPATGIVDFCVPGNPYFPTPEMFRRLADNLEKILTYYPSDTRSTAEALAGALGLHPQTVAIGNGSTELIAWIDHLLIRENIAVPIPTSGRWTDQPIRTDKRVDMFPRHESDGYALDLDGYLRFIRFRNSRVAVLCNPDTPDGGYVPRREVLRFVDSLADLDLVVVDESFIDFVDVERYPSIAADAVIRPNVIVVKSLGKSFGLNGIRLGYLVANPAIAGKVANALPAGNINAVAEAVVYLIKEYEAEYRESLRLVARDRHHMAERLSRVPGLSVSPSQGNFMLAKVPSGWDGAGLREYLMSEHEVVVRDCGHKLGMTSQSLRLVVRPERDVERLIDGVLAYGRQLPGASPQRSGNLIVHPASRAATLGRGGFGSENRRPAAMVR